MTISSSEQHKANGKGGRAIKVAQYKAQTKHTNHRVNHLQYGEATSVGMQRTQNEDALMVCTMDTSGQSFGKEMGLFILADGMGGHSGGEIASACAVKCAFDHLMNWWMESGQNLQDLQEAEFYESMIADVFTKSQEAVLSAAPGGGTTLTVALCIDNLVIWGHVGDSRLYHVNQQNQLVQISKDHSLVGRLLELGQISEDEVEDHPQKNVLIRALGQVEGFRNDHGNFYLNPGEQLVLCSDGLWGQVPNEEILRTCQANLSPSNGCERLVDAANANGGMDNISIIIVKYH